MRDNGRKVDVKNFDQRIKKRLQKWQSDVV